MTAPDQPPGPTSADEYKALGNSAFASADYPAAVTHYSAAIELSPAVPALFSNRSAAYLKQEQYDRARMDAEMAVELDPQWPKGHWRKGTALLEEGRYKDAVKAFEAGLEYCPTDSNLVEGKRKAIQYATAADSVAGATYGEFDIDAPRRTRSPPGDAAIELGDDPKTSPTTTKDIPPPDPNWPATALEEINRIQDSPNHYQTLSVPRGADPALLKRNYRALARILHPDKCREEGAQEAMTEISLAYETLTSETKKQRYDMFVDDERAKGKTFAEWDAADQLENVPGYIKLLSKYRGLQCFVALLFLIVASPLLIVIVLVTIFIYLPYVAILKCFFPEKYQKFKIQREKDFAKMEEEEQDNRHQHL